MSISKIWSQSFLSINRLRQLSRSQYTHRFRLHLSFQQVIQNMDEYLHQWITTSEQYLLLNLVPWKFAVPTRHPNLVAMSAVLSVELLSQTMSSHEYPLCELPLIAYCIHSTMYFIDFSSLNAGMIIDISIVAFWYTWLTSIRLNHQTWYYMDSVNTSKCVHVGY